MTRHQKKAFTLIELLIVVAIIAILAAIAVPNFLEAQVRAKVSRVKSDMRTIATAVESYTVDYNGPPPASGEIGNSTMDALLFSRQSEANKILVGARLQLTPTYVGSGTLGPWLSSPIAYITTFAFQDPFVPNVAQKDTIIFTYQTYKWRWEKYSGTSSTESPTYVSRADTVPISGNEGSGLDGAGFKDLYGSYRILSIGPDQLFGNNPAIASSTNPTGIRTGANIGMIYDPTNGTTSLGNIIRSQKDGDQQGFIPCDEFTGGQAAAPCG